MNEIKSLPVKPELEQNYPYKVPFLTFYGVITSAHMARLSFLSEKYDLNFNTVLHYALVYGLLPDKENNTLEDKIKEIYHEQLNSKINKNTK